MKVGINKLLGVKKELSLKHEDLYYQISNDNDVNDYKYDIDDEYDPTYASNYCDQDLKKESADQSM